MSLLVLAAIAGCNKSNDHAASKQFSYSGSSEALSEGRYNIQVVQTGIISALLAAMYFH